MCRVNLKRTFPYLTLFMEMVCDNYSSQLFSFMSKSLDMTWKMMNNIEIKNCAELRHCKLIFLSLNGNVNITQIMKSHHHFEHTCAYAR